MSQHDFSIANQGFPAFRSDLNDALVALASSSSGNVEPTTTYANQLWMDTTAHILKVRNEDNNAWISLATFDQATDTFSLTAVDLSYTGTLTGTGGASVQGLTVGRGAGAVSTNTAVGASALAATATGGFNTGVGANSLKAVTSGTTNTATGHNSLQANTTGSSNAAFGQGALELNTTGANNTALGYNALSVNTTASNNTALGYQSLYANTTAGNLVAIGTEALKANTTSGNSVAVGYRALKSKTGGFNDVAMGTNALQSLTTGQCNTAVGASFAGYAGGSLTTGQFNTFIGTDAGHLITTGSKNTIIGTYNGNLGGLDIRTASNYIVLSDGDGNPALYYNGAGTWNNRGTSVGSCGAYTMRDSTNTKYWSMAANSSNWYLFDADSSHYAYFPQNGTSWAFSSDRRLKENIVDVDYGLSSVMLMRPRRYTYVVSGKNDIGFIAQELRDVIPEAVSGVEVEYTNSDTPQEKAHKSLGVSRDALIPVLVKAIQELKAEFDAYKATHP